MPRLHPTAQVHPDTELADDVEIGPFCVIGPRVTLGPGCRLLGSNYLHGPLTAGPRNTLYPHACLGYAPQDRKADPDEPGFGVTLGSDNVLREGVTIHRGIAARPTSVGDHNYLMANAHLGHDVTLGNHTMLANNALVAGHVTIGDRVVLGGGAGIQQFVRVGRLALLSGCEGVTRDLPPFCTVHHTKRVGGLNLVGLRRAGYRDHIKPLTTAFRILYKQHHTTSRAVELIRQELADDPLCQELADFVDASTRGITGYSGSDQDAVHLNP